MPKKIPIISLEDFETKAKSEWKGGLEKAIEYYVEKEEYEQCSKIRDLINKL